MRKRAKLVGRRSGGRQVLIAIMVLFILMAGFAYAYTSGIGSVRISLPSQEIPLRPAEDYELERKYGPLAPIIKTFGEAFSALGGGGERDVGIEAEIGYTSTTGESIIFTQRFSGVQVGYIGMSGIYVKPTLGDYRALKLYDPDRRAEGEVWIKPAVRIRAFEGEVEDWNVKVNLRLKADGEVIDEKTLERSGHGAPPKKISFERYSVRGKALYALLLGEKQIAQKLIRRELEVIPGGINVSGKPKTNASKICFYADYQGIVKFKEEAEPVIKELKDVKLGCFDFNFRETGDFEMIVEKNVTIAPLAEVMGMAESGMEGMTPTVETVKVTVSVPYTTYLTRYLTTKLTERFWTYRVITRYREYTLTKTRTLWLTKTITKTRTFTQKGTTYTKTYTITSTIPITYTYTTTSTIPITYTYTKTSTIPITYTYTSTVTSTYTLGGTTYTTTYTFPVTTTYTSTKTIVSTSISYRYRTITRTTTKWRTTTVTKTKTVTEVVPEPYEVPYYITVTKTVTVTKHGGPYGGSVLGNVTVITPEGGKPIQDVRPGDLVLTERGFREVKDVKAIEVFNLYKIELEDGKALIADEAQPVITGEGVKRVGELKVGDELQALNGTVRITDIKRHELKAIVYDLIFEEPLNYYANGVLVSDWVKYSSIILLAWPYSEFIFVRGW